MIFRSRHLPAELAELAAELPIASWPFASRYDAGDLCDAYNQARAQVDLGDPATIDLARDRKAALIAAVERGQSSPSLAGCVSSCTPPGPASEAASRRSSEPVAGVTVLRDVAAPRRRRRDRATSAQPHLRAVAVPAWRPSDGDEAA